jgi:hypothetical protein
MYTSKWVNENLNADPIQWSFFRGEVDELLEAFMNWDVENIKEEISDVLSAFYCCVYTSTKISLPMIGAGPTIRKTLDRFKVWENIFKEQGLMFDKKYLVNGANYKKVDKVNKALNMARKEQ